MRAELEKGHADQSFWQGKTGGWLTLMLRLGLGGTFVWAAWHKIASPEAFAVILYGYGIFPGFLINILALWVPFIELLSGFCLITGGYRAFSKEAGLLVINLLLICFILIIGFNLIRGHEFDCGCFSFESEPAGGLKTAAVRLLIRDMVLLGAGGLLWTMFRRRSSSPETDPEAGMKNGGSKHADHSEA